MAENIHVKLPDGSVKDVPRGTSALDIAKGISPRLADAALAAQIKPLASNGNGAGGNGHQPSAEAAVAAAEPASAPASSHAPAKDGSQLIDLARPLEQDVELRLLTDRDPEALEVYRHSSAHLMAAAVLELFPETKLGHGPATESGFFYDFYREKPFYARRPGSHREEDAGAGEAGPALRARVFAAPGRPGALQVGRRLHEVPLHRAVHRARREDFHLQDRQVHRLLPRSAHPVDRAHQGVQGAQHRRRVLAGRREESAAAAHLRHLVLQQEGPRRVPQESGGSQEARPSRAGQAARPVFHPGAGRAGADLLASQGRHHAQGDGRLDARTST